MGATTRSLGATVLALFALTACNSDQDPVVDVPVASSTTAVAESTTTAPDGSSATTAKETARAATPDLAAEGLFDAWKAKNREQARRFASDRAIDDLFGSRGSAEGLEGHGCEPQGGQFTCSWRYEGGGLVMTVQDAPEGGFVVESIRFIAD